MKTKKEILKSACGKGGYGKGGYGKGGPFSDAYKKIKNTAVDLTSDFIANNFMGRRNSLNKIKDSNSYADALKMVRQYKGKPDSGSESDANGKPDELFRARATVAANAPSKPKSSSIEDDIGNIQGMYKNFNK